MDAIYDDVQAWRCGFEEATDRTVDAVLARMAGRFTPKGQAELAAIVRERCANDPRLRKALGGP